MIDIFYYLEKMKYHMTVLFGFLLSIGYGQTVYTSPLTENLNTQQIERLSRTITIGDKFIVIETVIDDTSSDIQQLEIKSTEHNIDDISGNTVYHCASYDGVYPTLIIVFFEPDDSVQEIRAIQPLKNGNGDETFRFLID